MAKNIEIKRYDVVDDAKEEIKIIHKEAVDFDSFIEDGFPVYLAYVDKKPVGFLSYLVSVYEITPESIIDDSHLDIVIDKNEEPPYEVEVLAFVMKDFRNMGISKKMLDALYEDLKNYGEYEIVYSLSKEFSSSSLATNKAFSELLLSLSKEDFIEKSSEELIEYAKSKSILNEDVNIFAKSNEENTRFELFVDNKIVGCLSMTHSPKRLFIHHVFVSDKLRGLKLGLFMLNEAMKHHFKDSSSNVMVHTRSSNIPAVSLYKSIGFKEIETLQFYKYKK